MKPTVRPENWSWKKLGDTWAAKASALVIIGLAALWVYASWDQGPEYEAPVQVVTSLKGVELGQEFGAVPAALGPFDKEPVQPHTVKKYADEIDYRQKRGPLRLAVRGGRIQSISYPCEEGRDSTAVNNIACFDFEDRIRKAFGERVRILCAKVRADDPNKALAPHVRAYDVLAYGTRYIVIKDVVQGFIVTDPKELESLVGYNWQKCG